mgnify:CR=1 FL=1
MTTPSGPYQDAQGRPRLRHSWVYYVDALGTREAARDLTEKTLRARLAPEGWYHRFVHHGNLTARQAALYFTDNIVVAAPADDEIDYPSNTLGDMLNGLASYIVGMAIESNIAYRGGVSIGPAFVADRLIMGDDLAMVGAAHGQAIIDTVLLEEHRAQVPRVVIDDAVIERIRWLIAPDPLGIFSAPIARDTADGTVFLGHLRAVLGFDPVQLTDPRLDPISRAALLTRYRGFIIAGMEKPYVYGKYLWLARYFNATLADQTLNLPPIEPIPDAGRLRLEVIEFGSIGK